MGRWSILLALTVAASAGVANPAAAQSTAALIAVPSEASIVIGGDLAQVTSLIPLLPSGYFVGSDSVLGTAIDRTLNSRIGVSGVANQIALFMMPDATQWAVVALGGTTGTPTATPVQTRHDVPIFADRQDPELFYFAMEAGFGIGTLDGVIAALDTAMGHRANLLDSVSGAMVSYPGADAALVLFAQRSDELDTVSSLPIADVQNLTVLISPSLIRVDLLLPDESAATAAESVVAEIRREVSDELIELHGEFGRAREPGDELAGRLTYHTIRLLLESVEITVAGSRLLINIETNPLSFALGVAALSAL